jgi:diacylglycerol kinase (ATP)
MTATSSATKKKRVTVILNGISLRKKLFYHHYFPVLSACCQLEVHETLSKNDAVSLASKATHAGVDVILAAGGDGTLNQVVNGILTGREKETKLPVIGVIPIGSGNDFARTVNIKTSVEQLQNLLTHFEPKSIDVGRIRFTPFQDADSRGHQERYFVNVADIGMGPVVVDKVLKSGRPFGHGLAYYASILSTFASYKPMMVKAVTKDWTWEGKLRTLGIANGKCYGHGLYIAPDAKPDDRIFNVFICGGVSVFDFVRNSSTLKKGKFVQLRDVFYKETTSIELTSEEPCMIEGDGEILGLLPASVELIEKQIQFLC